MSSQRQCSFFMSKRNRNCPNLVPKESTGNLCKHHAPNVLDVSKSCPFCRTPIDSSRFQIHLKKCPARPDWNHHQKYFKSNVNLTSSALANASTTPLSSLPREALFSLIKRVREATEKVFPGEANAIPPIAASQLPITSKSQKSTMQLVALANLILPELYHADVIASNQCPTPVVEMGCGSAELSAFISAAEARESQHVVNDTTQTAKIKRTFFLVDRGASKWKVKTRDGDFVKARIDIKDLVLADLVGSKHNRVACMSKHLCGAATDLTLKCLENFVRTQQGSGIQHEGGSTVPIDSQTQQQGQESKLNRVDGIVIALCCHHRCTFETYVNPYFITETLGFTPQEFGYLCQMSSWGAALPTNINSDDSDTNGKRRKIEHEQIKSTEGEDSGSGQEYEEDSESHDDQHGGGFAEECLRTSHYSGMNAEERRRVGLQIKALFDWGRVAFLKSGQLGEQFKSVMVKEYTDSAVTPENKVLVAGSVE